jgi:hypothetical protein
MPRVINRTVCGTGRNLVAPLPTHSLVQIFRRLKLGILFAKGMKEYVRLNQSKIPVYLVYISSRGTI